VTRHKVSTPRNDFPQKRGHGAMPEFAKSDGNGAKCFDPRHGIRATAKGKTVDLVICFECNWVYVYYDNDENRQHVAVTTREPQAVLDKTLKDAGVPLPKPAP